MYKKFNVLIIEDESDMAKAIADNLLPMLLSLNLDVAFNLAEDENEVMLLIDFETYDLISLDGILRNRWHASPTIKKIFEANPGAVIFSLSVDAQATKDAKDYGLTLCLSKNYKGSFPDNEIILRDDLAKIKQAILLNIKYQVPRHDLIHPVSVFSENYADSTPSERHAKDHADLVGQELIKNHICFAAVDRDYFVEIAVSHEDLLIAKSLATQSDLQFWQAWLDRYSLS